MREGKERATKCLYVCVCVCVGGGGGGGGGEWIVVQIFKGLKICTTTPQRRALRCLPKIVIRATQRHRLPRCSIPKS